MAEFDPDAYLAQASRAAPAFDPDAYLNRPSVLTDVAQALPTGLAKGAIGFAGAPADTNTLNKTIGSKIGNVLGISPETQAKIGSGYDVASRLGMLGPVSALGNVTPGAEKIRSGVESVTGPLHEPQTVPGQYAQTLGEFAPALLGNKGSLVRSALTNVALPAVASETAGQATAGTAAEPYARLGAALASPVAAEKVLASRAAAAATRANVGSAAELKQAAKDLYQHPDVKQLEIAPSAVNNTAAMIENDLLKQGFRATPESAPGTFSLLRELRPSTGVKSVNVDDIDAVRKALGRQAKQRDLQGQPTENANAAQQAIRHIDDYLTTLDQRPGDILRGDAAAAVPKLQEARANYAAYKRASEVDYRLNQAERQAAKSGSGSNLENAMRQKIDKVKDYGLSPSQVAQKDSIVLGTGPRNILRKVGKLGVDGGLSLMLHAGSALASGGATLPVTIAGTLARKIGEGLTRSQIGELNQSIRAAAPLSRQRAAANPIPQAQRLNLLKALLLSNAATLPARMPVGQMQP